MIRWMRSLLAWRTVWDANSWRYLENGVTGQRQAVRHYAGYSPLDFDWLDGGVGDPMIDGAPVKILPRGTGPLPPPTKG